jgi:hypothetical protein
MQPQLNSSTRRTDSSGNVISQTAPSIRLILASRKSNVAVESGHLTVNASGFASCTLALLKHMDVARETDPNKRTVDGFLEKWLKNNAESATSAECILILTVRIHDFKTAERQAAISQLQCQRPLQELRAMTNAPGRPHYPPFNALIYSLENCLPLVKFGQDEHWQPDPHLQQRQGSPAALAGDWRSCLKRIVFIRLPTWIVSPAVLRWFRWIMIAAGWVLATFFVAGLSGIVEAR